MMLPTLSMQLVTFSSSEDPDWSGVLDHARAADQAGIDRLVVSDHIAFGNDLEDYGKPELGGIEGGRQPTGPDGHWLEPLTVLSMIAAQTTSVRLQTGILQAALRRPAVLAKTTATLDVLSGGRLDLGIGVGWQRAEYDVAGLDFDSRGRTLDHTLDLCMTLWTNRAATFESADVSFTGVHTMPKPAQPGGVPIWVSGRINPPVLRRIARFGRGWIPWGDDALDPGPGVQRIRAAMAEAGRQNDPLQVQAALPLVSSPDGIDLDSTMAAVGPLADVGVTDFKIFVPARPDGTALDELTSIVTAFRANVGRAE